MTFKAPILLLLILVVFSYGLEAQDCLEYPEIDGSECIACVPEGWSVDGSTSPDIILDDGTYPGGGCTVEDLSGASPGGGNMSLFVSSGSGYQEGMSTTVSGLSTGQEYGFGFYWEEVSLGGCSSYIPGALTIILDGEVYEFSGSADWEFIEICFTPSESTIEIEVSINASGQNAIVVDSPSCDDITPCCPLSVSLEEEEYEICPGEEFLIEGQLDNAEGDVLIEWTSDPSDGIDFLDATDILSPTFSFPDDENFDGETYEFTLTVQDDNCAKELYLTVVINPSEVPEFEINICEISFIEIFPNVSLNGYTGSWSGNFDFEELIGTIQEYTFILDPDQDNCIEEYVFELPINPAVEITFEYNNSYCVLDDEDYEFPEESEEDIEGEWLEDDFNPSDLGVGIFTFLFQPNLEFCAFPYEAEIEVFEESILTFDIPDTFCVSNQNFTMPNPSLEGIYGNWEELVLDLSSPQQNQTIVFTPEDVLDCYQAYIHSYTIIESTIATFDIPDTICSLNNLIVFDSTSLEGISGYWTPLSVDADTIMGNQFTINWTPLDNENVCFQGTNKTITIREATIIDIELPESICRDYGVFSLPLSDINGALLGDWNIPVFDTDTVIGSMINLTFTPLDDECTEVYNTSIEILNNIDPEFSFPTEFCSTDEDLTLNTMSDNGIEGTWSIATIQPSLIADEVTSVFTPNDPINCVNSFEVIFTVSNLITPQFDLPLAFCADGNVFTFPVLSLNNIQGTWSETDLDPSIYIGNEITNTFTPLDLTCNEILNITLPIIRFDNIQGSTSNASTCLANDGSISFDDALDFEFSIDNGVTWQNEPIFDNLGAGNYQIIIRHSIHVNCTADRDFQLTAPSAPVILMLEAIGISDCDLSDGMVTCTAEGSNLEFSIDDGVSWQSDNIFSDLSVGSYIILVRADGDSDCSTQQVFSIENIVDVLIEDVLVINISDCELADGEIFILPNDPIYEYSIDGSTWQESNLFSDLQKGDFTVTIRLKDSPNCTNERLVNISSPINPIIIEVMNSNPSDCGIEDGSISIEANGVNIEFSIDNGTSWSDNNIFENLPSGIYTVVVREKDSPNCTEESSITLETPNTPEITDFEIKQPADCISNDGSITITTSNNDVEFSIDGGTNWQSSGMFENLDAQNYELIVRNTTSPDCTTSLTFEIIEIPCPCNNLDIEIRAIDANCFNPNSGQIDILNIDGFFTNQGYDIIWSTGSNELSIDNLSTGWYAYEVNYDKNCTHVDSVFIDSFDPIDFALLSFDPNCNENGSIEVTDIEGGNGQFQFSLDGINYQEGNVFFNLTAAAYEVLIEDNFDCSESRDITLNPIDNLNLDIPAIDPIEYGEVVFLNPLINQTTIDSFEWTPQVGILNPDELIAQVSPEQTTEYTLTIYFGNCVEIRTIIVEVVENNDLYLGNTFSPNFDGNNDYFFIQSSDRNNTSVIDFSIFDRWGNKVFQKPFPEINNEKDGWNGSIGTQDAEIGVYTYLVRYESNNSINILAGTITLTR